MIDELDGLYQLHAYGIWTHDLHKTHNEDIAIHQIWAQIHHLVKNIIISLLDHQLHIKPVILRTPKAPHDPPLRKLHHRYLNRFIAPWPLFRTIEKKTKNASNISALYPRYHLQHPSCQLVIFCYAVRTGSGIQLQPSITSHFVFKVPPNSDDSPFTLFVIKTSPSSSKLFYLSQAPSALDTAVAKRLRAVRHGLQSDVDIEAVAVQNKASDIPPRRTVEQM